MNEWKKMNPEKWGVSGAYRMLARNTAVLTVATKSEEMQVIEGITVLMGKGAYTPDPKEQITTITVWDRVVSDLETQGVDEENRPQIKYCFMLRGDERELFEGKHTFQEVETVFFENVDKASSLSGHEHYLACVMDQAGGVC